MPKDGIGARLHRKEDRRFLTGRGRYTADINRPGQVHACFVRSPHAHARIVGIDTSAAEGMPGVLALLTGDDVKADGLGGLICGWMIHSKDGNYGTYNVGLYSNPELDEKIRSLGTMTDLDARDALVSEIWTTVQEDRVLLPIHNQVLAYAMRSDITLPVHPENQPLMTTVTFGE